MSSGPGDRACCRSTAKGAHIAPYCKSWSWAGDTVYWRQERDRLQHCLLMCDSLDSILQLVETGLVQNQDMCFGGNVPWFSTCNIRYISGTVGPKEWTCQHRSRCSTTTRSASRGGDGKSVSLQSDGLLYDVIVYRCKGGTKTQVYHAG